MREREGGEVKKGKIRRKMMMRLKKSIRRLMKNMIKNNDKNSDKNYNNNDEMLLRVSKMTRLTSMIMTTMMRNTRITRMKSLMKI